MSFNMNIGNSQPVIKPATNMNNDGGSGGNTGFMQQRRKKNSNNVFGNIFDDEGKVDSFTFETVKGKIEEEEKSKFSWLKKFL